MVFLNDSMAFVGGKLFGKYSLHPIPISPKKTIVGFIFGISSSILISIIFKYVLEYFSYDVNLFYMVLLGLITGIFTILGDLFASALKRSAGIKDSGQVDISGRGGLLDSFDSLIFCSPVVYYLLLNFRG